MKKSGIFSRLLCAALALAMLVGMVPLNRAAAAEDEISTAEMRYITAGEDGVTLKNNGETITLPIRVNNFLNDGMLFDYLSSMRRGRYSEHYQWEYSNDDGKAYVQLYPFKLDSSKTVGYSQYDVDTLSSDGFSSPVTADGSLDGDSALDGDFYGTLSDGVTKVANPMTVSVVTDDNGTKFLRLTPDGTKDANDPSGRAWRKLTHFNSSVTVDEIRYAVLIYRVNHPKKTQTKDPLTNSVNTANWADYTNMLLAVNSFDEVKGDTSADYGNLSNPVTVHMSSVEGNWQYAIIDMRQSTGSRSDINPTTKINDIYLRTSLCYKDSGCSLDLAAVGYFPYYGDAEQFAYYGLTLGCKGKYYEQNNSAFNMRTESETYTSYHFPDYNTWIDQNGYGDKYEKTEHVQINNSPNSDTVATFGEGNGKTNLTDTLGYNLFGVVKGYANMGLLESSLDENGRPVYKEGYVTYMAHLLRHSLCEIVEYPSDNNGWRNYSFVTGSSSASGEDEAVFGKDELLGHSLDLGSALCAQLGVNKGSGVLNQGTMGTYANSARRSGDLVGPWNTVKGNIKTWHDAAYYLLHNLYATENDKAFDNDGYGEYENTYKYFVLPQVEITGSNNEKLTTYFFDSGYSYEITPATDTTEGVYETALDYNTDKNTITLKADAEGKAQFRDSASGNSATYASYFPFLLTSGNGTPQGETNSPYYLHHGVNSRGTDKWTYRSRDYNYALSGSGDFSYKEGLYFNFEGDDDVYVFINGQLVVDIGGTHGVTEFSINLDDYVDWAWGVKSGADTYKGEYYSALGKEDRARVDALALEEGGIYSFDFFYMERHGVGSNLRIITNIEITQQGLDVDKIAHQNGTEVVDNGMIDVNEMIRYGFSVTNNSENKMYRLKFSDPVIGVSLDWENGLTIAPGSTATDEFGLPLEPKDLKITVTGINDDGETVSLPITCETNDELKAFLTDLRSDDGTGSGVEDSTTDMHSGSGLWVDATISIDGIYHTMTSEQRQYTSFRNYVIAEGDAGDHILRGSANHTIYQPGNPAYYHWVNHPIYIENERLYKDLVEGKVVESAEALPSVENMILMCTNAAGTQLVDGNVTNKDGGDVYLKVNYTVPGSYMVYVTILDKTNPNYKMTVPITIYAVDTEDSYVVLDYGLDSYLTDSEAIFDYELEHTAGDRVTGTVMGIAESDITPSYKDYDENRFHILGNETMGLTLRGGSHSDGVLTDAYYELDEAITLRHDVPWVIEWRGTITGNCMLFSGEENGGTDGNTYLYINQGELGLLALGHRNSGYQNYGIAGLQSYFHNASIFRLYNVPASNGNSMVYLSINNVEMGAMNNYYVASNTQNTTSDTFYNDRDFVIKWIGTKNFPVDGKLEYLHIYENGEEYPHHSWVASGKGLSNEATGEDGYIDNVANLMYGAFSYADGCITDTVEARWKLDNTVTLNNYAAWELEFKIGNISTGMMLMSSTEENKVAGNTYIYLQPYKNLVTMGYYDTDVTDYVNYAIDVSQYIDGFDMQTSTHVYKLKNVLNPDGSNMVHLYVDGAYVGPLDTHSIATEINNGYKSNGISGRDFAFNFIGGDTKFGLPVGCTLYYLDVRMDTVLRDGYDVYQWVAESTEFASVIYEDPTANQITFEKDQDGVISHENATFTLDSQERLKFEINDFMDETYAAYLAMTIHSVDFTPTALEEDGIDIGSEVQMYKKVTVLPATVVYYEDDFVAIKYPDSVKNQFTDIRGSSENVTQGADPNENYGSDNAYDTNSERSGGVLSTIKIENKDTLAYFEFTGTGFEIVARTNATDSATIKIKVYNQSDVTDGVPNSGAAAIYERTLITEFDNKNNGGTDSVYQVPVFRVNDLQNLTGADGTNKYTVLLSGVPAYNWNDPNWDSSKFNYGDPTTYPAYLDAYLYLDGIRIYQPLGASNDGYTDTENGAVFVEIRKAIVENSTVGFVQYTGSDDSTHVSYSATTWVENRRASIEGNTVDNAGDYLIQGPNNEVYMDGSFTNSALVFRVEETDALHHGLQIAVRGIDYGSFMSADSTGVQMSLQYGIRTDDKYVWVHVDNITGSTEQYYTIPYSACQSLGDGVYQVVVRVIETDSSIPALASFSSLKLTGLELVAMDAEIKSLVYEDDMLVDGETGETVDDTQYPDFMSLSLQMRSEDVLNLYSNTTPDAPIESVDPDAASSIKVASASLSFESEIFVNLYYTVQDLNVAAENMGLLIWKSMPDRLSNAGADAVVCGSVYDAAKDRYMVKTEGIAAKNLGDDLYLSVYAKLDDGTYVYSKVITYSPKTYAVSRLEKSDDTNLKALCAAMLNYGAAAQEYFGYKTDDLMNAVLSEAQKELVSDYSADLVAEVVPVDDAKVGKFVKSDAGFAKKTATVSFNSTFNINFYFTADRVADGNVTFYYWNAASYAAAETLCAENCTGSFAMSVAENGAYWASYDGIAAKEIDQTIYVCAVYESEGQRYCTGVIAYSLGNYCVKRAADDTSVMQDLAKTTAVYGYHAKVYFGG